MAVQHAELEFSFDDGKSVLARIVQNDPIILEIPPDSGNKVPLSKIEPFLQNSRIISQAAARLTKLAKKP